MTQPTQRPNWLPLGAAICSGPRETVRQRVYIADAATHDPSDPHQAPFMQMIYSCEHGEWLSQAEAWSDHELHLPELTPNPDQSASISGEVRYESPVIAPPAQLDS